MLVAGLDGDAFHSCLHGAGTSQLLTAGCSCPTNPLSCPDRWSSTCVTAPGRLVGGSGPTLLCPLCPLFMKCLSMIISSSDASPLVEPSCSHLARADLLASSGLPENGSNGFRCELQPIQYRLANTLVADLHRCGEAQRCHMYLAGHCGTRSSNTLVQCSARCCNWSNCFQCTVACSICMAASFTTIWASPSNGCARRWSIIVHRTGFLPHCGMRYPSLTAWVLLFAIFLFLAQLSRCLVPLQHTALF